MAYDPADDFVPVPFVMGWSGDAWTASWHPPETVPSGRPHGSQGICVAEDGLVLISGDGQTWGLPGGRPEGEETWLETLIREVQEEACAVVEGARLLGFTRGECLAGQESGLVLTRAMYRADVRLAPWEPQHEVAHRRVVPWPEAWTSLTIDVGLEPIYARALWDAGFPAA